MKPSNDSNRLQVKTLPAVNTPLDNDPSSYEAQGGTKRQRFHVDRSDPQGDQFLQAEEHDESGHRVLVPGAPVRILHERRVHIQVWRPWHQVLHHFEGQSRYHGP